MKKHYLDCTKIDCSRFDRARTIFCSVISPVEVHGPHLPLGTDLFVAKQVMDAFIERLGDDYPIVVLPELPLGAQPVPGNGSLPVPFKIVRGTVKAWGDALARMGFRYWVLFDNHGGFSHQIALAEAARYLDRKYRFRLIVPFLHILKEMANDDPAIGLAKGINGDREDQHAGTNETSLMLAIDSSKVDDGHVRLPSYQPKRRTIGGLLLSLLLREPAIGFALDWIGDPAHPSYLGSPALARVENGRIMLEYHVSRSLQCFSSALNGSYRIPYLFNWFTTILLKIFG